MKFESWFPTVIGSVHCPFIDEIQSKYKKIIKNYPSNKDGFINHRVHCNKKFKKLNDWVAQEVNKFSQKHKFAFKYEAKESWLWDYKVGAYQDFHAHPGHTLSTIFFLEGYKEDTATIFKNPIQDMKNPFNTRPHTSTNSKLYNSFTYRTCLYPPQSGILLVWRSYVEHRVAPKQNTKKRIVFVYNFDSNSS
jgi:uncharacterized protein (TIGR02466 family)